ncbi:cytochrome P450 monooxygenase 84 [Heterobasidion irregulare TC 32-1]|uniref:Cytochrome P450 monooxygenase 84 n=1 Tax=Heterobasidion irregulare (strain TC 32-1) TaxID=747525 RepID=W4K582_HETIT|nr:cytochrome P450 monooxygenase 84 [Heterobasidion irregulare TC 32-1]ETW80201.1 cytochrome P450 monooxygenase 84 [Heterobasidion irregulare TC 32-1]
MRDIPFEYVKKQMAKGFVKPLFTPYLLEHFDKKSFDEEAKEYYIKSIAGTAYPASSATMASGLNTLILMLVMFPDVQERAHAEIDRVIGSDRLPEFSDEGHMPYIAAIVKEVLRWAAFVPFAVPHSTAADDMYKGYFIPKGTFVIGNS